MSEQNFLNKLAELSSALCDEMPTPDLAILTRATARLRRSGLLQKCLQLGETVPDFNFIDHNNHSVSIYKLLDDGPVVINFVRGFWCRYCQTELEAYADVQLEMSRLGCHYLAISPQRQEEEPHDCDAFQVIFDKNNQIARKFNILYALDKDEIDLFERWGLALNEVNESLEWSLPIPATYLVAQDRKVVYQFADVDFRSRCCPDALLEELKQMSQK